MPKILYQLSGDSLPSDINIYPTMSWYLPLLMAQ